ncbi:hypothetical protein BDW22DRAFT_1340899, partial [Trametopsis cervina]
MREHRKTTHTQDKQRTHEGNSKACKKWRKRNQFPPHPASRSSVHGIIRGFVEDSTFEQINESGCAVCGCLYTKSTLRDLEASNIDLNILEVSGVTRKERISGSSTVEPLSGPVLTTDGKLCCITCYNALNRGVVPKNALANGLWIGDVPCELQGLSWMEQKLVARIATNYCVIRVHSSGLYKMRTNVVCRATPMKKIYSVLPPKRADFEEVLAILFIGPTPPTPTEYKRTLLLIRRDKVWNALQWLQLNHIDYADIKLSQDNLNEYSENEPPVIVDYHPITSMADSESTAVNNHTNEDSTDDGQSSFVVHGLTGDQLSDMWKDDPQSIRLKAM